MISSSANLFTLQAAYDILNEWLSSFSYRTSFSVWFLLISSSLTLLLTALAAGYRSGKL